MTDKSDMTAIVALAREAHQESRFRDIPFSAAKVEKVASKALQDQTRHGILMALRHDDPVGFLYCSVGEYHIGSDVLLTTIHNLNVRRDVRKGLSGGRASVGLMQGAWSWSKARGAREILFHVTSGVDLARAHKFAKHMGMEFVGGSYVKLV